jgi:arylsulfatase A
MNTLRLLLLSLLVSGSTLLAAPPNVILIMADDFGYECVTANGGESYRTPVLDRLAATGVRFEHCHVQPLCTPTRVELMTGLSNVRNYLNFGTLPRKEVTFAHLLKKAGYATGIAGKWQLGREPDSPRHFGFEESCLWQHTRRPARYANPGLEYDGVEKDFTGGEYGPDLVNQFALDFVARHRAKPFFLYYPMILTHDPYQPTPDSAEWDAGTKGEAARRNGKHFAEMVAYMDKLIGHLVARLEELELRENTLLLFLGDNGTGRGVTSRFQGADYPGGKGTTTVRGMRVPLIANWPAAMKEGRVNRDLIGAVDFLPTLCAAAGTEAPAGIDGVSFLPQLRGEPGTPRDWLYSWYSPRQGDSVAVQECAFDLRAKLYRDGRYYDLAADPFERSPQGVAALTGPAAANAGKLQAVLDRFKDARPAELDRAIQPQAKKQRRQP